MFHDARMLSDKSLIKMMSYPSAKKRRNNYYSSDSDEAITNIQTENIVHVKTVHEYRIPRQTLVRKCRKKKYNIVKKSQRSLHVLGEAPEKDFVAMVPFHEETVCPGGMGDDNT